GRDQAIQRAIPGTQLAKVDLDPLVGMPVRQEAPALAIANEVGLQPAGQTVLAGRTNESIGQQHEGAVRIRRPLLGLAEHVIEQLPQSQLLEKSTHDENRSPGGRFQDIDSGQNRFAAGGWLAARAWQAQQEALLP